MEKDYLDFFNPTSSSRTAEPREQTPQCNFLATVKKPTAVTLSCCGKFTGEEDLNLVICKGTLVSIYLVVGDTLKHLREFPVFGMVIFMEISYVNHLRKAILFIATETAKLCIFEWDTKASNVVSPYTKDFIAPLVHLNTYSYSDLWKGGTVSPRGNTVVVYSRRENLWIVDIGNFGVGNPRFTKSMLFCTKIVDVKFLKNRMSSSLKIALLYRGVAGNFHSWICEISTEDVVRIRSLELGVAFEPRLLIPNNYGFLIIGNQDVVYFDENETKTKFMGHLDIQAYGTVNESFHKCTYLLGGHDGHLLLLEIKINSIGRFSSFSLRPLGKTSRVSSITYLRKDLAFVGSRVADSQLLKIHQLHEPSMGTSLELLMVFSNSGPVIDFCITNQRGGKRNIVMSCGTREDCSLESIITGVGVTEKLFVEAPQIQRIWSLKSSSFDANHTFLILQGVSNKTAALTIDGTGAIITHHMDGLTSDSVTVCCHEAVNGGFMQVIENSVRLIDFKTGFLLHEWPSRPKILFASATARQVLLANTDNQLVYLELRDGRFVEERVLEGYAVACLNISTVGTNSVKNKLADPPKSKLAAVGLWTEYSIQVLSLPNLEVLTVENGTSIPRCILLCEFERQPYLLCARANGSLTTFKVNEDSGELEEKDTKEFGDLGETLHTISTDGVARVFYSTVKAPRLIFTKNQTLQYNRLNLTTIKDMCPFQRADIPEGLAIVTEDGVLICTMGDIEGRSKIPMVNYVRRICHQEESESYAILVEEKNRRNLVQLLDKEFNMICSFSLNEQELGLSIISCSFVGDDNAYYCVGTSMDMPVQGQGRLLVFRVRDRELQLVLQAKFNKHLSHLKASHGGLLVIASGPRVTPHYLEWMSLTQDVKENPYLAGTGTKTAGDERVVAISYSKIKKYEVDDTNIDLEPGERGNATAMLMLPNGTIFHADGLYNIYATKRYDENCIGRCFAGQFITQMNPGTLSRLPDEDYAQAPSIILSTASGAIQVIVSLPKKVFDFLSRMQKSMWMKKRGNGYPYEVNPFKVYELVDIWEHAQFIDGDFIESFPTLSLADRESIAKELEHEVEILMRIAAYVTLLR